MSEEDLDRVIAENNIMADNYARLDYLESENQKLTAERDAALEKVRELGDDQQKIFEKVVDPEYMKGLLDNEIVVAMATRLKKAENELVISRNVSDRHESQAKEATRIGCLNIDRAEKAESRLAELEGKTGYCANCEEKAKLLDEKGPPWCFWDEILNRHYKRAIAAERELAEANEKLEKRDNDCHRISKVAEDYEVKLEDAHKALGQIANGDVPSGFLNGLENWTKEYFQEKMFAWCQTTAKEALAASATKQEGTI